jgi:hypothetical protein
METKVELKARLEKALRRPIPQTTFDKFDGWGGPIEQYFERSLVDEGDVRQNFQALKGIFAEELDYLKRLDLERARTTTASLTEEEESTPPIELEPWDSSYVRARARAISEVWAALADERPDVTVFRQTVLGERLLSPTEASSIVDAPGGTLDERRELELRKLGSILANDYYGWDEEGAIWYVLTGKAPRLRPVRVRARGKHPVEYYVPFQYDVTFSILPWVPVKEIERAYRKVQEQLLEETPRETDTRILDVVQFWWEQFRARGPMPSWPAWFELWNQTHPDKRFTKWRYFREYFFRGTKKAQSHYKRFPQPTSSARYQEEMSAAEEYAIKAVQGYRKIGDRYTEVTFE